MRTVSFKTNKDTTFETRFFVRNESTDSTHRIRASYVLRHEANVLQNFPIILFHTDV